MSLIKLQGNASGTGAFTIAAPNSNTDRTLTLPDATGTVNVSGLANEVPAGSAGAPAIYPTGDTNTGIFFPAADTIAFAEGGSEVMRINSSGNVGVGTSSPTQKFHVAGGNILVNAGSETTIITGGLNFTTGAATDSAIMYQTGNLLFGNSSTERMRLDTAGNLFLGTPSLAAFPTQTTNGMAVFQMGLTYSRAPQNTSGRYWYAGPEGSAGATYVIYNNNNTGAYLAYGGTSWSANSDERMKTTLVPFEDAVGKVCSLRAGTGRYLTDEEDVSRSFLIAQDVRAVLPEAVDVQEDEQGTLGLRYTDIVPLLVAAIKEQQAQIEDLKAEVAALKGASA